MSATHTFKAFDNQLDAVEAGMLAIAGRARDQLRAALKKIPRVFFLTIINLTKGSFSLHHCPL